MRRLSLVGCSLAFAACGSNLTSTNDFSSPVTACRSFATSICTRESTCKSGIDVNSCAQLLANSENCNEAGCASGSTYSPTNAQQCSNDYLNQSCPDSANGVIPLSCAQSKICVPAP